MNEADLAGLNVKRGLVKGRLTRIYNDIKDFKQGDNVRSLYNKLETIKLICVEFYDIQTKIELIKPTTSETEENSDSADYMVVFDKLHDQTIDDIHELINKYSRGNINYQNSSNANNANNNSNITRSEGIRLPTLELPLFSGSYSEWLPFYDTFDCLIHQNEGLTKIQKFHYLKSCLKNEAGKIIEALTISNANYDTAWSLLKSRFENKRLISEDHIRAILNFPGLLKPSCKDLRGLIDTINTNLAALRSLELPVDSWDALLLIIVTDKLDFASRKEWQAELTTELPEFAKLKLFLDKRFLFLESLNCNNSNQQNRIQKSNTNHLIYNKHAKFRGTTVHLSNKIGCAFCQKPHLIYRCQDFLKLSVPDRINNVKRLNLCQNCLRSNHQTEKCRLNNCTECNRNHNRLLHLNVETAVEPIPEASVNSCISNSFKEILLSTAVVLIKDKEGNYQKCRALLDNGSQSNLITKSLWKKLGLTRANIDLPITGISQQTNIAKGATNVTIKSCFNSFSKTFDCLILPKITQNLPLFSISLEGLDLPANINLADPTFHESGSIDLLISAEIFWTLLCDHQNSIKQINIPPYLHNTHLGWVLGGPINILKPETRKTSCNFLTGNLETLISKFWEVEDCNSNTNPLSKEDNYCEQHFMRTHDRDSDGRFIVKLPFKEESGLQLGPSKESAVKRYYALEAKLQKNPCLKAGYTQFMTEYQSLGHMQPVLSECNKTLRSRYFLPHHAVFKETSVSTKLRVVFDGSAKATNGESLNENLLVGPKLQQDLFNIITRFRTHKYVLTADISKMFRQIWVHPDHRHFQNILWRDDATSPVRTYELNTVTYGTTSAPYLAVRCLQQLAHENKGEYPLACETILRDFYMDDLLTGSNHIEQARQIRDQLIYILLLGGFDLCKWASNNPELLPECNNNNPNSIINLDTSLDTKALGLLWNCKEDILKFDVVENQHSKQITKRIILSATSQIFDPLGLIGPVLVLAKIIIQKLWVLKLGWDDPVPNSLNVIWNQFTDELPTLNNFRIPRLVLINSYVKCELHGFCDASQEAYGAAIYLRSFDFYGNSSSHLLCAKSRVAPIKTISLPRLELCGALILARLTHKVLPTLNLNIDQNYFWTDSTIVLAWLSKDANNWKQFVGNRVAEIQSLTNIKQWNHVISEENPADIISRGMLPTSLSNSSMWYHGPTWLQERNKIPESKNELSEIAVLPEQRTTCNLNLIQEKFNRFDRFSEYSELQRVIAYCLRFINSGRITKKDRSIGELTCRELNGSSMAIMRQVQMEHFTKEYNSLADQNNISNKSKLLQLNPFFDEECRLIRVGGRLKHSNLSFERKYPIIMPSNSHITRLLIQQEHENLLHAGIQATLASLRQKIWPLSGRSAVRNVIHRCITCFRCKPTAIIQKMGNLPKARVEQLRPFIKTGIDYAGPILIKEGRGRKNKPIKAYIALFICFSTKAIHLELVGDLTTESFIQALNRFIARRGNVSDIYSDNATNFVGADRELKELSTPFNSQIFKTKVINNLATNCISWHFIPPRSPHFGGLWEAGVKSVKHHLNRTIAGAFLTYEELYTVLTRIESILNSRPLTPLSNDPNDLNPLTPGHFLIGEPMTAPPEPSIMDIPINRLSRWQRVQQINQHFWRRWSREYLGELQGRLKWNTTVINPKIGDMVLLKQDNTPPLCWKLGRITELHPGSDNITRVVSVKTVSGTVKRAVKNICVLPLEK